jgi:hypothetical protein
MGLRGRFHRRRTGPSGGTVWDSAERRLFPEDLDTNDPWQFKKLLRGVNADSADLETA